ncbi:bacteriocin [Streptococcus suis]|nr:bacteriocin [Streptococcus suis]NQO44567.1 bacteriocin [Streptococcus suis]NQO47112.1 bacteriocin [Streptococcus suis]WNF85545.1 Blp family class II bacteriocin [Streptococcus suis]HEM4252519.1 Blp family class II bacteriocin [Streptococcus suis]
MNAQVLNQFETLNFEVLENTIGGGCNWKDAGKATVGGAIGGAFGGGLVGAAAGAVGGYLGYSATCWW